MALPNVKNTIIDGAMGVQGASSTGNFAAIGVGANPGGGIKMFSDPDEVEASIGDGPLRDLLVTALSIAKTTVYAIALEGTTPGTLSAVTAVKTGTGTVTVSGSPRNEYDITVEILSDGVLNTATFRVITDGLPGKRLTVPADDGAYAIPGTGLTVVFNPGAGMFKEGDTFSFSSTAPAATNGEIIAAATTIIDAKLSIDFVAVAGDTAAPMWASLATMANLAAENFQYLFFVVQARGKAAGETVDQYVMALAGTERGSVVSTRLQICSGWIEEADTNGQIDERGIIGVYCGRLASIGVHEGPDAVKFGGITAATAIKPDGLNDAHIETLANSGYVTVRQIAGLKGIYFTSGKMACEAGSDYDLVERRRVMDKACRLIRTAQLPSLNDAVKVGQDGSPEGIKMLVAKSKSPLEIMKADQEISDGDVIVPEGQNILSTNKLRFKIRIVPLGKLAYIENEIAYSNPALGGE
jgi:hypothetical protein